MTDIPQRYDGAVITSQVNGMLIKTKDHIQTSLNASFKLLNLLSIGLTIYFCVSIANRILGNKNPDIYGIPISQGDSIYVLMVCTILHIAILRYIIHYLRLAWINLNVEEREELYFGLTGANHLITKGAERMRDAIQNENGFLSVQIENDDPSSLLHKCIFIAAVFACIRYELSFDFVWTFCLGMALAMANWQIGSSWVVALADLGRVANSSLYFDDLEKRGPRYFGIVSGPWHGMNNNIFIYSAVALVDAFLRILPITGVAFVVWLVLEFIFWMLNM